MTTGRALLKINTLLVFLSTVGFLLSLYSYMVETTMEKDASYQAMCDISERVSCSKAFMSEYGKGFGLISPESIFYAPNCIYGLISYTPLAVISLMNTYAASVIILLFGIASNILTVYLVYILYILNDICVICVSMYVVNAIILVFAVKKYNALITVKSNEKKYR